MVSFRDVKHLFRDDDALSTPSLNLGVFRCDNGLYHLDSSCNSSILEDFHGRPILQTVSLNNVVQALCSECDNSSHLEVVHLENRHNLRLKVGDLVILQQEFKSIVKELYESGYKDCLEAYRLLLKIGTPVSLTEQNKSNKNRRLEDYVSAEVIECFSWFSENKPGMGALKDKISSDFPSLSNVSLLEFFAQEVLSLKLPKLLAQPESLKRLNETVESEVRSYLSNPNYYLTVLPSEHNRVLNVFKLIYPAARGPFLILPGAALDYLQKQIHLLEIESIELKEPPSASSLEALEVIYQPNNLDSPYSSLLTAFKAAQVL